LRRNRASVIAGRMSITTLKKSLAGWFGHLQHADTWRLRQQILQKAQMG
jgi:hypothetical protein